MGKYKVITVWGYQCPSCVEVLNSEGECIAIETACPEDDHKTLLRKARKIKCCIMGLEAQGHTVTDHRDFLNGSPV